ncbi:MAG: YraN family protein [Woeseiaceae bacterium]
MVPADNRAVGDQAEALALRYLTKQGLVPVRRNFSCRLGELDLIMRDKQCLVVVEVRYRNSHSYVAAKLTIDWRKQKKIIRTAAMFLAWHQEFATMPLRFDVVGVDVDSNGNTSISWTRDAFRPADASL